MSRQTAMTYYAQEFEDPTQTFRASTASVAFFWTSVVICVLAFFLTLAHMCGKDVALGLAGIIAILARICYIVCLPIIWKRVNDSWIAAQYNLDVIADQETFHSQALECGDRLAVMNTAYA